MRWHKDSEPLHRAAANAFSLAETVIAIVVVAVMLVASLNAVGVARVTQRANADRTRGQLLAQHLVTEIMAQYYEDPALDPDSFGLGGDENTGDRSLWDDVDDYDGWLASPPQYKDGTAMSGLTGWGRSVEVDWVNPQDLTQKVDANAGVKRIIVEVKRGDKPVALLVAIRTSGSSR